MKVIRIDLTDLREFASRRASQVASASEVLTRILRMYHLKPKFVVKWFLTTEPELEGTLAEEYMNMVEDGLSEEEAARELRLRGLLIVVYDGYWKAVAYVPSS